MPCTLGLADAPPLVLPLRTQRPRSFVSPLPPLFASHLPFLLSLPASPVALTTARRPQRPPWLLLLCRPPEPRRSRRTPHPPRLPPLPIPLARGFCSQPVIGGFSQYESDTVESAVVGSSSMQDSLLLRDFPRAQRTRRVPSSPTVARTARAGHGSRLAAAPRLTAITPRPQ